MPIFMRVTIFRRMLVNILHFPVHRTGQGRLSADLCVGGQTLQQLTRLVQKTTKPDSMWHRQLSGEVVILLKETNDVVTPQRCVKASHVRKIYV